MDAWQHPCQASRWHCWGVWSPDPDSRSTGFPWPAASLQLIENKESRVAQPGFSRRYLVGCNEREPELQGGDYKAALPTNAAGNNTSDSISSAGNEHKCQPSLRSSRLQGYLSKKDIRYPEWKILLLPVCLM